MAVAWMLSPWGWRALSELSSFKKVEEGEEQRGKLLPASRSTGQMSALPAWFGRPWGATGTFGISQHGSSSLWCLPSFSINPYRAWKLFRLKSELGSFSPPSPLPSFILLSVKHRRKIPTRHRMPGRQPRKHRGLMTLLGIKSFPRSRTSEQPQISRDFTRAGEPRFRGLSRACPQRSWGGRSRTRPSGLHGSCLGRSHPVSTPSCPPSPGSPQKLSQRVRIPRMPREPPAPPASRLCPPKPLLRSPSWGSQLERDGEGGRAGGGETLQTN